MTEYNKASTYKIEDINFDMSPMSTFQMYSGKLDLKQGYGSQRFWKRDNVCLFVFMKIFLRHKFKIQYIDVVLSVMLLKKPNMHLLYNSRCPIVMIFLLHCYLWMLSYLFI